MNINGAHVCLCCELVMHDLHAIVARISTVCKDGACSPVAACMANSPACACPNGKSDMLKQAAPG